MDGPTVIRRIDNGNGTTTVVVAGVDLSEVQLVVPDSQLDNLALLPVYSAVADMPTTQRTMMHVSARDKRKYVRGETSDT